MLDNEENRKDLDEIGSIITNKINQQPSCSQDGFPDTVKRYTGKGSRFYFTLQLKPVESDLLHEMTPDLSMDFTGKRVFVVEDNALNMEIACMLLDTFGIEVKEVYNGKKQWKMCVLHRQDIMMQEMDGLEVTRMIRQPDREGCKTLLVNVSLLKETLASILG